MSVLIIHQDNLLLSELQSAFREKNQKVIITNNSLMAMQLFFRYQPRVVILDVAMPDKDGFEIVKEIRAVCENTFIMAMSANYTYLQAIKKLGANAVALVPTNSASIVNSCHGLNQCFQLM